MSKKITQLTAGSPKIDSLFATAQSTTNPSAPFVTTKVSVSQVGDFIAKTQAFSELDGGTIIATLQDIIENKAENGIIADDFDDTASYSAGDYCLYEGLLYKFNDDKSAGSWDASVVDAVIITDEFVVHENTVSVQTYGGSVVCKKVGHLVFVEGIDIGDTQSIPQNEDVLLDVIPADFRPSNAIRFLLSYDSTSLNLADFGIGEVRTDGKIAFHTYQAGTAVSFTTLYLV